jgi:hypothetical protein
MNASAVTQPSALARFVDWLASNSQRSNTDGRFYNYLPRSSSHSLALCGLIIQDLILRSAVIRDKAQEGRIAFGLNVYHTWPNGKTKNLDLAIGITEPLDLPLIPHGISQAEGFSRVLISCEAKNCMTEHGKSQPRLFDELSSSHEIVHQGDQLCIAAGIAVINIAPTFVSPLRQHTGIPLVVTQHNQPGVTSSMIAHLRGLPIRNEVGQVGFDAFTQAVVNCNNQNGATLHTELPAPQPGQPDHFDTFMNRIGLAFEQRFASI